MSWNPSRRSAYEAALRRALKELMGAYVDADSANDQDAVKVITSATDALAALREASMQERKLKLPKKAANASQVPQPMKGQLSVADA